MSVDDSVPSGLTGPAVQPVGRNKQAIGIETLEWERDCFWQSTLRKGEP